MKFKCDRCRHSCSKLYQVSGQWICVDCVPASVWKQYGKGAKEREKQK